MRLLTTPRKGVYVEFKDRERKRKSECVTVPGLTPKQAIREFVKFMREHLRKAG